MSAVKGKKIAIVGGGPGGLTLARLLQQSDAQVDLYGLCCNTLQIGAGSLAEMTAHGTRRCDFFDNKYLEIGQK